MVAITLTYLLMVLNSGMAAEICSTRGCQEIATIFQKSMDLTVNPCDDFYHFTCGSFMKNTSVPDAESEFGVTEEIDKTIRLELKSELEAKTTIGQPTSFQKAKDFYFSCMDTTMIEKYSIKHMKARLNTYGGWPVLQSNWNMTNFDWIKTTNTLKSAGQYDDQIVSVFVDVNGGDTSKRIVTIDSGYHVLSTRLLLAGMDDEVFRTYYEVLVNISVAFGADRERAKRDMREVVQFEAALVNLTTSNVKVSKVPKDISELQEVWPYIPWLDFIRTNIGFDLNITNQEPVTLYNAKYFQGLGSLLNKTPQRLLANYIMAQVLFTSRENLNKKILNISQRLNQVRYGKSNLPPRWEFCLGKLLYTMDAALGATYIRKYFHPASKMKAKEIATVFKEQLVKIIRDEDWMDTETKERAINKVESIKLNIGYPDELLNGTVLDKFYEKLRICRWDLYGNTLAIWKWSNNRSNKQLRQPVNPSAWDEQALIDVVIANGRYGIYRNAIDIFAAILQQTFFSEDRPPFLNYGTLSSIIGHELTHSVDNRGKMYDEHGNYKNWWTESSNEAFQRKAKALADEYSTYVVKEVNLTLNGVAIQGEVIADQGGYKIARLALDSWLVGKDDVGLVGMEKYTAQQLFWLGAASAWCTKETPEFLRTEVLDGDHPPAEFRVNARSDRITSSPSTGRVPVDHT